MGADGGLDLRGVFVLLDGFREAGAGLFVNPHIGQQALDLAAEMAGADGAERREDAEFEARLGIDDIVVPSPGAPRQRLHHRHEDPEQPAIGVMLRQPVLLERPQRQHGGGVAGEHYDVAAAREQQLGSDARPLQNFMRRARPVGLEGMVAEIDEAAIGEGALESRQHREPAAARIEDADHLRVSARHHAARFMEPRDG